MTKYWLVQKYWAMLGTDNTVTLTRITPDHEFASFEAAQTWISRQPQPPGKLSIRYTLVEMVVV